MVQKAKKLKNNFFRPYANAGIILFIPTMLVKELEANFYRANNTKCQYFGRILVIFWYTFCTMVQKAKKLKKYFFPSIRGFKISFLIF
jgi:hypothetical protein